MLLIRRFSTLVTYIVYAQADEGRQMNTCADQQSGCSAWAESGECLLNPGYMNQNCPQSCDTCAIERSTKTTFRFIKNGCWDKLEMCYAWSSKGLCQSNFEYMSSACPNSCGICQDSKQGTDVFTDVIGGSASLSIGVSTTDDTLSVSITDEVVVDTSARETEVAVVTVVTPDVTVAVDDSDTDKPANETDTVASDGAADDTDTDTDGEKITGRKTDICADHQTSCSAWAELEECLLNPVYMSQNCPHSCDTCATEKSSKTTIDTKHLSELKKSDCRDKVEMCSTWSSKGQCQTNFEYMSSSCPKSCGICQDSKQGRKTDICADHQTSCSEWAELGECLLNPGYMSQNCPHSCDTCAKERNLKTTSDQVQVQIVGNSMAFAMALSEI